MTITRNTYKYICIIVVKNNVGIRKANIIMILFVFHNNKISKYFILNNSKDNDYYENTFYCKECVVCGGQNSNCVNININHIKPCE